MCETELETEQNCNILTSILMAISVSFPFSWATQPGAWGPSSLGGSFLYCILFLARLIPKCSIGGLGPTLLCAGFILTGLVTKLTDFLSSPSYTIVQRPPCGRHNFALIQPVHGQGYNILIDRIHLLFALVHFLFWQPGRVVGQYTTIRCQTVKFTSICIVNTSITFLYNSLF